MIKSRFSICLLLALGTMICAASLLAPGSCAFAQSSNAQSDNNIRAAVLNSIKKSDFKNVRVMVTNGIVDLQGVVKDFATKMELEKRVQRVKSVAAVRNDVQVAGAGMVSDQEILKQLIGRLQYDRVGYGNAFNAIMPSVRDGVVTLGGHALGPVAADSAVDLASRITGVRDVVNDMQIDPVSPMDWRIRLQVYRAVYGFPTLQKYAIDPAQPIRITVVNGHVILNGIVLTQADKDDAGLRANTVPGVFSVTNDLQVAQPAKKKQTEQ